ncbi:unnamed protein product [Fraxinus pennsylvanica]|uniref:Uncharacterized protein n=1 Tax=Fraxinus pennsylvanica TaxID=56036 RepID=A0AAD1ZPA5_9LAMI|nr:unnamed protein product [Fraxinus pennsylvanica]
MQFESRFNLLHIHERCQSGLDYDGRPGLLTWCKKSSSSGLCVVLFVKDEFADIKISEVDRQRLKIQNSTKMKQGICNSLGIIEELEELCEECKVVVHIPRFITREGAWTAEVWAFAEPCRLSPFELNFVTISGVSCYDFCRACANLVISWCLDPIQSHCAGSHGHLERGGGASSLNSGQNLETRQQKLGDSREKKAESSKKRFSRLSKELDIDERWFLLLDYLSTFGLKESHFIQMYERHMPSLQINVDSVEERLGYLLSVGVKHKDIRKIILRQPQILGYTVKNNLKSHVAFLGSLGIPESRIGQIITATPSLFSYSIDNSLRPTVRYLLEEIGIEKHDLSKVVQLGPQILVQRIDNTWTTRFNFLTKELGAPRESIVKMVTKHPQILHYSIEDGLRPRINFLRSIGMCNSEILKVLTSLTQRIRPRHRFLVSLKKAPKGPFPLSSLVPTDESFCHQWAGTSLDKYLDFRERLLLKEFAKKYERQ